MPGKLSKGDEKKWKKAKRVVRKQKGKKKSQLTDRDWALVQHIFQGQKKASLITTANALDSVGEFVLATTIDNILENL